MTFGLLPQSERIALGSSWAFAQWRFEKESYGHGSFDYVVEANSGITVLWSFDNDLVQMVSNYIGNDLSSKAGHWSKQEGSFINIERPTMVIKYNSHMDGVHLYNMLISLFQIWHQSTKYFMYIIFYCIGVAVVNCLTTTCHFLPMATWYCHLLYWSVFFIPKVI